MRVLFALSETADFTVYQNCGSIYQQGTESYKFSYAEDEGKEIKATKDNETRCIATNEPPD